MKLVPYLLIVAIVAVIATSAKYGVWWFLGGCVIAGGLIELRDRVIAAERT